MSCKTMATISELELPLFSLLQWRERERGRERERVSE